MVDRWKLAILALALSLVGAPSAAEERPDIEAWNRFCDRLKETGAGILKQYAPDDEVNRAQGPLYLASTMASAVERVLIGNDAAFPLMRLGATTVRKWGLDGADAKYSGARVRANGMYRLHGKLGSARLVAVQVAAMEPRYQGFDSLTGDELEAGPDGSFELMIGRQKPPGWKGPWIRLHPVGTDVLVREYFDDWEKEEPSELYIERLDAAEPVPPPSTTQTARLMRRIGDLYERTAPMWIQNASRARAQLVNKTASPPAGEGLRDNVYGNGWFRVAPDEALIIELDEPEARLWSFQLGNFWWQSLDYVNRTGSLNGHQAVKSSDGRYRLVIAHRDPGVPNWLDPAGHTEGMILYRYQQSETAPRPTLTLVPAAELAQHLPADTKRVSADERRAGIARRRAHAARRWSP